MPGVTHRPVVVLLLVAVLIAGCGSPDLSPSAVPSASTPAMPTPPTAAVEPSATPSQAPTPTTAPTPADPFLGQVVVTVSDNLRVRSEPRVSDDSVKYEPLLPLGTELTVTEGPVNASGYVWYKVVPVSFSLRDGPGNGWVAIAGRDGEAWIALAEVPIAAGWPVTGVSGTVIGPDGTAYAWMADAPGEQGVAAFDSSGAMRPGWPFRVTSPGTEPSLAVDTDGSLLVGTHGESRPGFALHRLGSDGREVTGWPYREDDASYCSPPVIGAEGTTVVACSRRGGQSSTVVVIDEAGRVVPGWPVTFDGVERLDSAWGAAVQLGTDGTVYALGTPNDRSEMARLWAYAPDGSPRRAFPVTLESRVAGYLLDRDRILVASYIPTNPPPDGLCAAAARTVLAELDIAGRVVPGWPVTAPGWASQPVIGADGTVYYLVRDRLFARDPGGSVRDGWPVASPPVAPECTGEHPYLGADGTLYAMNETGLAAFSPDGRARPGWPFEPVHGFAAWFCTTDAGGVTSPVFGADGRVYAAIVGAKDANWSPITLQVVALDSMGRVMPGWPYTLPGTGHGEVGLLGVIDGRLYVSLLRCGASDFATALLALDADGSLSD